MSKDIPIVLKVGRSVSNSWSRNNSINALSTSPTMSFHSPQASFPGLQRTSTVSKVLKPFDTKDIKVLLLENVNTTGVDILKEQGYQVETIKSSLPEDQLIEKIKYESYTQYSLF
jgi:D-3-phosphoglycerate dehydrogenase